MRHPDQVFVPGLAPASGPAEAAGDPADQDVLGVHAELRPEPAADVRGDDPDLARLDCQHPREPGLGALRALVRDPRDQPAVLAPDGSRAAGLHRRRGHALVDDRLAGDHLAAVEQVGLEVGGVAPPASHVGARVLEQQRVIARVVAEDRGQRVVVHRDQFERILPLVGLGDHDHRDRLADESDLVGGQQVLLHLRLHRPDRRDGGQVCQVRCGEHRDDAGGMQGRAGIDAEDPGVRDRRPDEEDVAGALEPLVHEILDVHAAGGQEPWILRPQDAGAQDAHLSISSSRRAARSCPHSANPAVSRGIPERAISGQPGVNRDASGRKRPRQARRRPAPTGPAGRVARGAPGWKPAKPSAAGGGAAP